MQRSLFKIISGEVTGFITKKPDYFNFIFSTDVKTVQTGSQTLAIAIIKINKFSRQEKQNNLLFINTLNTNRSLIRDTSADRRFKKVKKTGTPLVLLPLEMETQ